MSNSLPERIRVFILKGPTTGKVHKVTFDAGEAVGLSKALRDHGIPIDIEEHIATRGFGSNGVIEFRCYPCPSHHLISVQAVDGPSEVHDGCCDTATKRAAREEAELGLARDAFGVTCDQEGHDYEDVEVEHQDDDVPVSMNAFTDAIRYQTVRIELVTQKCRRCGAEQIDTRDCKCSPDRED